MAKSKRKKSQFTKGAKRKTGNGASNFMKYGLPSMIAVVVLATGIFYFVQKGGKGGVGQQIDGNASYDSQKVEMTDISAQVKDGKMAIPLKQIKQNKLVYFEYKGDQTIPLLAYISPSGRVVAAVSMCEPCKSTRFHIQDNNLVCNACGTTWNIDTLEGISGGCLDYPPDVLDKVEIGKDQIVIDANEVSSWQPRV
jgi:uncharacterized membrane protein